MRLAPVLALVLTTLPAQGAEERLAAETDRLVAATAELFDALEGRPGSSETVIRSNDPQPTQAALSDSSLAEARAVFRPDLGPVSNLTAYRIDWYPASDLLGAVDFVGTWGAGGHLVCGFVVWNMDSDASPVIESVEATYLESSRLMSLAWEDREIALLSANCASPDIAENFDLVGAS